MCMQNFDDWMKLTPCIILISARGDEIGRSYRYRGIRIVPTGQTVSHHIYTWSVCIHKTVADISSKDKKIIHTSDETKDALRDFLKTYLQAIGLMLV